MSTTGVRATTPDAEVSAQRLNHFPVSFFAIPLGLAGLTLAFQKAHAVLGVPWVFSTVLLSVSVVVTLTVVALYLLKSVLYPRVAQEDFVHPVRGSFFPILAKIPLILAIVLLERSMPWSRGLWIFGAALQLGFSLVIVSRWMARDHEIAHISPAWFIPIVGNVIVPIAGVAHGFRETSWFFFATGLLFWLALFVIIVYRLLFHQPLSNRLSPTLFILFAPPAIAFIAYTKLTGGNLDSFGRVLFYAALFLFLLVMMKVPSLIRLPFFLSWWAYTFPLAALTLATLLMHQLVPQGYFGVLAGAELVMLSVIVAVVATRTVHAIYNQSICVEES